MVFVAVAFFAVVALFAGVAFFAVAVALADVVFAVVVDFAGVDLVAAVVFAADFFAGAVFAVAFLAVVFFAGALRAPVDFVGAVDFAAVFFAGAVLAADFVAAVAFLAAVFFAAVFVAVFLAGAFFAAAAPVDVVRVPAPVSAASPRNDPAAERAADETARDADSARPAACAGTRASDSFTRALAFLAPDTTSLSSFAGLNVGTSRFFLPLPLVSRSNTPSLLITTLSPASSDLVMASTTESSACCATSRLPSNRLAMRSTRFLFFAT